jgi:hypothetical protein
LQHFLIEAILNGQLPLALNLEPLNRPIPLDWAERREFVGLSAHHNNSDSSNAAAARNHTLPTDELAEIILANAKVAGWYEVLSERFPSAVNSWPTGLSSMRLPQCFAMTRRAGMWLSDLVICKSCPEPAPRDVRNTRRSIANEVDSPVNPSISPANRLLAYSLLIHIFSRINP